MDRKLFPPWLETNSKVWLCPWPMRPLEMVLVHSERAASGQRSIKIQTPSAFYNSISPLSSFHSSQRVLLSSQLNISNHLMHFKEAFRLRKKNSESSRHRFRSKICCLISSFLTSNHDGGGDRRSNWRKKKEAEAGFVQWQDFTLREVVMHFIERSASTCSSQQNWIRQKVRHFTISSRW